MDADHTISQTGGIRGIGFPSRDPSSRGRHARSPSRSSSPLRLGRVLAELTPWEPEVHGRRLAHPRHRRGEWSTAGIHICVQLATMCDVTNSTEVA